MISAIDSVSAEISVGITVGSGRIMGSTDTSFVFLSTGWTKIFTPSRNFPVQTFHNTEDFLEEFNFLCITFSTTFHGWKEHTLQRVLLSYSLEVNIHFAVHFYTIVKNFFCPYNITIWKCPLTQSSKNSCMPQKYATNYKRLHCRALYLVITANECYDIPESPYLLIIKK